MAKVQLRPQAIRDLADIWTYIAEDSPAHADRYIDVLDKKFAQLARRPGIGRARPKLYEGLRSFPVGNYVVFYLAFKSGLRLCAFCMAHAILKLCSRASS